MTSNHRLQIEGNVMPLKLVENVTAKHAICLGLLTLLAGPIASGETRPTGARTCESVFSRSSFPTSSTNSSGRNLASVTALKVDHRVLDAALGTKRMLRQSEIHELAYRLVLSNLDFFSSLKGFNEAHETAIHVYQGLHAMADKSLPRYLAKVTLKQGTKEFDLIVTFRSNGDVGWLEMDQANADVVAATPEGGLRGVARIAHRDFTTFLQNDLSIDDVVFVMGAKPSSDK